MHLFNNSFKYFDILMSFSNNVDINAINLLVFNLDGFNN